MKIESRVPKIEYRKVLYTTDLSESGRFAFPYAASIANRHKAQLTVLHVVEAHDFEKYLVGYIDESLWDEIKDRNLQEARSILLNRKREDVSVIGNVEEFCRETVPGQNDKEAYVSYDVSVEVGDPVEVILNKANNENYDLIVIGKHGHGALKGALIGDTAQRVVRRSSVPVLVVEVPEEEGGSSRIPG